MMAKPRRIDWETNVRTIIFLLKRDLKAWREFELDFVLDVIDLFIDAVVFIFIATLAKDYVEPLLRPYGGDYLSYIILGIFCFFILDFFLSAPRGTLSNMFWTQKTEVLMIAPLNLSTIIAGASISFFFKHMVQIFTCLIAGLLLGLKITFSLNSWLALLSIFMGGAACLGLGLIAASTFYLLQAKSDDPVTWMAVILAKIVSGVYYPLSILPNWARLLSHFVPHTYVLDVARKTLIGSNVNEVTLYIHELMPLDPLLTNIFMLLFYSLVTVPIGLYLLRLSFKKAKTDGRLSRWT